MKKLFYLFLLVTVGCGSYKSLYKNQQLENQVLKQELNKLQSVDTSQLKAVVELNKMNVVYRGVNNPITISAPNSTIFEASAPGLRKIDNNGNYVLSPGSGNEVLIEIRAELKNGNKFRDTKILRIKDIGRPIGTLNGIGHGDDYLLEVTKAELENGTIGVKIEDFLFDLNFMVKEFDIKFPNGELIHQNGNEIGQELSGNFMKLKKNDIIYILNIKVIIKGPRNFKLKRVEKIKVSIID